MWADLIVIGIKTAVGLVVLLTTVPIMVWIERRGSALIQDRLGPNRVGPFGLFQPVVDAVKLITKENLIPSQANRLLYLLAPAIALITSLSTFIAVPFGQDDGLAVFGQEIDGFIVAPDLNIGILYIFAIASLGVYSTVLAGWASNNKYSLYGGIRASAQAISYELAMTISVVGVLMAAGSLHLQDIVAAQIDHHYFGFVPAWNCIPQFIGAITFMIAVFAETNRLPFDLPEAEAELVSGYNTEYSAMKFAAFFMSEYVHMTVGACLITILFFGGWDPLFFAVPAGWLGAVVSIGTFASKVAFFLWFFVWVRWTLPRFRFDQLMALGWKVMVPLSVLNFLLVGLLMAKGIL